jgi:CheY-like chemotaxis protein
MRILVVEDQHVPRGLVLQQLKALGYAAEAVTTGVEAIQKLLQCEYDLILMDVGLPDMDGLEASKKIREVEQIAKQRRIPIVGTTGFSNRRACLDAGMDDFLQKPVLLDQLRTTLDRWLKYKDFASKLVLVVEDDHTNRTVLSLLLERMGVPHDFADNGKVAVSMARTTDYALILMDIRLPELDGYRATKAIRASASVRRDVPIVAVTAQAMEGDLEKCIWAGMNDYLPKPYTREDLESVVSRWLK